MAKKITENIIENFPEDKVQEYSDVDALLKSSVMLDITKAMTRAQVRILDFIEEAERSGHRVRQRDQVIDNGSFGSIYRAIAEGQKYGSSKKEKGEIL